ncbi:plasma kallikrein [Aplysia californica]|uniref:Plasma kallikrein n=1 Tax=Aplysia californica TaxID=6500 RepID=A0ABM0JXF1_APLCA|nr:plasma kallikrein [Aplysia californica]
MGNCLNYVCILLVFLLFCLCKVSVSQSCPLGTVRCNSTSLCLPDKYLCDGDEDCEDGEDEVGCGGQPSGCGDLYEQHGTSGTISSMGYPVSYSDRAHCHWHIVAPQGYSITLEFVNVFDLERPRHGDCIYDSVMIYGMAASSLTLLGRYCGDVKPGPVSVGGNEAVVEFQSDDQTTGRGFNITWSAKINPADTTLPTTTRSSTSQSSCVFEVGGDRGSISSPGYDEGNPYPSPFSCKWKISVDSDHLIALDFSYLNVGIFSSSRCQNAWLKLFDGPDTNHPLLGQFCDAIIPGELLSTSNNVTVEFWVGNNDNNKRGFKLTYVAFENPEKGPSTTLGPTPPGCDGNPLKVTSPSGFITSPNFDSDETYRSSLDCEWTLQGEPGTVFYFHFLTFDLEQSSSCDFDYLNIFDVIPSNNTVNASTTSLVNITASYSSENMTSLHQIETLCGFSLPYDIVTGSNHVVFRFHSDDQVEGSGFNISYETKPPPIQCPSGQFLCGSDECVDLALVCDEVSQCMDGTDELVCPSSKQTCGVSTIPPSLNNDRIVGGKESVDGAWPWTLSVLKDDSHQCGATLILPGWALCAAHCFEKVYDRKYDHYSLIAARHQLGVPSRHEQRRYFADVIIPRDYVSQTSYHDIALIKLTQPFNYTDYVGPACLPNATAPVGTKCYVTGWGDTAGTCCQDLLKQAAVPVMNTSLCSQPDYYGSRVKEGMMCAGYPQGGVDACEGDSGGPLVCPTPGQSTRWEIQGITSWGLFCAFPKNPGVYTIVRDYLPWIQQNVARNSD